MINWFRKKLGNVGVEIGDPGPDIYYKPVGN